MKEDRSLEIQGEELESLIRKATVRILRYLASLPSQPSADNRDPAGLARSLREEMPESGEPPDGLLDLLFGTVIPRGFNTAGPGYLAYIPGGGLPHSAVADLIADATNRYVGVFAAAPGLAQIETNVIRWFCAIVGYPETAGGILTTGGSPLQLLRPARRPPRPAARELPEGNDLRLRPDPPLDSEGGDARRVSRGERPGDRPDARFRIRLDLLSARVAADRAGFLPSSSSGTRGPRTRGPSTTSEAARGRPRGGEKALAAADAAYGGFFALTERGRARLAGMERSDSVVLDPHKSLFLPYGNGSSWSGIRRRSSAPTRSRPSTSRRCRRTLAGMRGNRDRTGDLLLAKRPRSYFPTFAADCNPRGTGWIRRN